MNRFTFAAGTALLLLMPISSSFGADRTAKLVYLAPGHVGISIDGGPTQQFRVGSKIGSAMMISNDSKSAQFFIDGKHYSFGVGQVIEKRPDALLPR